MTGTDSVNISVIVCTYNRSAILARTLNALAASVLPQSTSWEILVVDNNSTDSTREVLEELSRTHPGRFRILFEPRQGKSYALNTGIRQAHGEILAFTDDDVFIEPRWLGNLTASLHDGTWAGAGGRIVPAWAKPLPSWLSIDDPDSMGPFALFHPSPQAGPLDRPPYGANMAFRREMFEKYGDFRGDISCYGSNMHGREDIEIANRMLKAGERLRYEPDAVVHHPALAQRMEKKYVLNWWFGFGYMEVMESGPPFDAKWVVLGVPLFLFRRMARWTLQWMVTLRPARRFSCSRNVWYIAGTIVGCFKWAQQPPALVGGAKGITGRHPHPKPGQASGSK